MRTLARNTVVLTIVALALAGCGEEKDPNMPTSEQDRHGGSALQHEQAELQSRPSIEEAVTRYERMKTEIRERLSNEMELQPWRDDGDVTASGCAAFPNTAGESRATKRWVFDGALSENQWIRAEGIVNDVIRNYGFPSSHVLVNSPSNHEFTSDDNHGARLSFGTGKRTILSLYTGCHLPQAEKDKTAPKPQGQAAPNTPDSSTPQAAEPALPSADFGPFDPSRFASRRHG